MAFGSMEEIVVAQADAAAGRVIPQWRYWVGYLLIPLAWIGGGLTVKHDTPVWLDFLLLLTLAVTYVLLLSRFKKRSIR